MPAEDWTQLATRVPKTLHRQVKLQCVKTEMSVMDFVCEAIAEKIRREAARGLRRRRAGGGKGAA